MLIYTMFSSSYLTNTRQSLRRYICHTNNVMGTDGGNHICNLSSSDARLDPDEVVIMQFEERQMSVYCPNSIRTNGVDTMRDSVSG